MPNTREKLIELICSTEYGNSSLIGNNFQKGFIEKIADHIIAHGVTVQGEIDEKTFQLMRECERLKEENQNLSNAVNVLEEINSDLCKQIKGVTVQEWIPVEEKLPEEDGQYLVYKQYCGYSSCAVLKFAKDGRKVDKYDFHRYWKNVWYGYDSEWGYYTVDDITHWQPIPELPKGE